MSERCAHCRRRIHSAEAFTYSGHSFCCECMSALCSWFLDGGQAKDPEAFDYVFIATEVSHG